MSRVSEKQRRAIRVAFPGEPRLTADALGFGEAIKVPKASFSGGWQ